MSSGSESSSNSAAARRLGLVDLASVELEAVGEAGKVSPRRRREVVRVKADLLAHLLAAGRCGRRRRSRPSRDRRDQVALERARRSGEPLGSRAICGGQRSAPPASSSIRRSCGACRHRPLRASGGAFRARRDRRLRERGGRPPGSRPGPCRLPSGRTRL